MAAGTFNRDLNGSMGYYDTLKYMKALLTVWLVSLVLLSPAFLYAQSLREFFSNRTELNRDDLPDSTDGREELSFDEVICKDKELFPKNFILKTIKHSSNASITWTVFRRLVI